MRYPDRWDLGALKAGLNLTSLDRSGNLRSKVRRAYRIRPEPVLLNSLRTGKCRLPHYPGIRWYSY